MLRFMPTSLLEIQRRMLVLALLCLASPSFGAQSPPPKPARPATNAVPALAEPPKSVFHIPASAQDPAKDPFFPQSTRLHSKPGNPVVTNKVAAPVVKLELKGISGTADRRFAIINSHTFAAGEQGEVPVGAGRLHIRVVEIKTDSVVVEANGAQQVLHLRPGL